MPDDNTGSTTQSDNSNPSVLEPSVGAYDTATNPSSSTNSDDLPVTNPPVAESSEPEINSDASSNGESDKTGGSRRAKTIATILGIILLVSSVAAGVFLVSQSAEFRTQAWDCTKYVFEVSEDGVVTTRNGSTRNEPSQRADVKINGELVATLDVPALDAGEAATIGNVPVPDNGFFWEVIGSKDCEDQGSYEPKETPTPSPSPTPEPTVTGTVTPSPSPTVTPSITTPPSATPTTPPITASCGEVHAYDEEWNQLDVADLSALEPGDTIYIGVGGTSSTGFFSLARFTINGTTRPAVRTKHPTNGEFVDGYTIPEGVVDFIIEAEIHHDSLGWI